MKIIIMKGIGWGRSIIMLKPKSIRLKKLIGRRRKINR